MTASPEKAVPIPAEVRRQIKKLWLEHGGFQFGPRVEHYAITEDAFWQFIAAILADRASQEERIRAETLEIVVRTIRDIATRFEPRSASQNNLRALADAIESGSAFAPSDLARLRGAS